MKEKDELLKAIAKLEVKQEYTNETLNGLKTEIQLVNKALIKLTNVNDRLNNLSKRVDEHIESHERRLANLEESDINSKIKWAKITGGIIVISTLLSFVINKIF